MAKATATKKPVVRRRRDSYYHRPSGQHIIMGICR